MIPSTTQIYLNVKRRFDFLVTHDAADAAPGVHLIEVTEPGACVFDWTGGATVIQTAVAEAIADFAQPTPVSADMHTGD